MNDIVADAVRANPPLPEILFKNLKLDRNRGVLALVGVRAIRFTRPTLVEMLAAFMLAPEGFLTGTAIYQALYWNRGEAGEPDPAIIKVWVHYLRKEIRKLGCELELVWGKGYQLKEPAQ